MGITSDMVSMLRDRQNILRMLTVFGLTDFLWPMPATVQDGASFDFVIVGGGTAGCIIAGRLAEMNATVLLIEAGGYSPVETFIPALFQYSKHTKQDWNFTSTCNTTVYKYRRNHQLQIQQGRGLGGSQQANYLLYGVGHPKDYDRWAQITKDRSWSWKKIKPIIIGNEHVIDKSVLKSCNKKYHGTKGNITLFKYNNAANQPYFDSYKELGNKVLIDINANHTLGYTNAYFTVSKNGIRQTTAYRYLSPHKDNSNLFVMYDSTATKIIFDENKQAVGIKILTNGTYITVKANKEVIITAGAIKSPQLLMASGIGPREHLENLNITVLADLPVGDNLHDNPSVVMIYKMGKAKTIGPFNPLKYPVAVMEGRVALRKCKKTADYEILSGIITQPEFFEAVCASVFGYSDCICDYFYQAITGLQVHYVTHHLLHSKSRGTVRLNCSDPLADPLINPCYYCNNKDLEKHAKYLEHYNRITNTTFYRSVNSSLVEPEFCADKSRNSREWWKCYVLGMSNTLHQYGGTCASGKVVDPKMQVMGMKKVRVGDSSVMPTPVGSTIMATVMMIANKLVNILIKEYYLVKQ